MKKRWHERSLRYHALEMAEVEEEKKRNEEERLRLAALKEARETERANRHHAVDVTDNCYNTLVQNHAIPNHSDTSPLLLDAVVTPLLEPSCTYSSESTLHAIHCRGQVRSAREERNRAFRLARK